MKKKTDPVLIVLFFIFIFSAIRMLKSIDVFGFQIYLTMSLVSLIYICIRYKKEIRVILNKARGIIAGLFLII